LGGQSLEEQGKKDAEAGRKEFWERTDSIAADWPKPNSTFAHF
jgi:hypothetical protein